jgi:hypothetical protein
MLVMLLLSMLLCQKSYLCSNSCMIYDLIDFKPNVVFIFKTCPSMTNICTTIGLYTKSFDNQISKRFPCQLWPKMTGHVHCFYRTCPTPGPDISGPPDISGLIAGHIRPSGWRVYIVGVIPLRTIFFQLILHFTFGSTKSSPGDLGAPPSNPWDF